MENIEKACPDWFPGIWEMQRFTKNQKMSSCLGAWRLASWPLYGGEGGSSGELFGHQGADGLLVAYDDPKACAGNIIVALLRVVNVPCD